jgi:hypothetical protein
VRSGAVPEHDIGLPMLGICTFRELFRHRLTVPI